jgi:hypothetical protein
MKSTPGGNAVFHYRGRVTQLRAVVVNGPMVALALQALDIKLGRVAARAAVRAGGEVIKKAWAAGVPVDKGHYRDSIQIKTSSSSEAGEEGGPRTLKGASAVIYVGRVAGVDEDDQPIHYAKILEFGGTLWNGGVIQPGWFALTAFGNSVPEAVDAVSDTLRLIL